MPARLRDIVRALRRLGVEVETPSKGSHWKARKGSLMYPIPAHNAERTSISDVYIRGVCRALELNEEELRSLL